METQPQGWQWPDEVESDTDTDYASVPKHTTSTEDTTQPHDVPDQPQPRDPAEPPNAQEDTPRPNHGRRRKCRICLEKVEPTYPNWSFERVRGRPPAAVYESAEEGPLICPCQCKGSLKWVHAECLKRARFDATSNPEARVRCSVCNKAYQLAPSTWAMRIRSPIIAFFLAVVIMALTVFALGFVAEPILSLWLDPYGTISDTVVSTFTGADENDYEYEYFLYDDEPVRGGWIEHFIKGIFSLGLLGFVKSFLVTSPWQWWNLRTSGMLGGGGRRRGGTGRDRIEGVSLLLVAIGVITFFVTVWRTTREWTQQILNRTSERILNFYADDPDDPDQYVDDSDSE